MIALHQSLRRPTRRAVEVAVPQQQRRPRFFYGWVIVAVAALSDTIAFGAGGASFSVFMGPMGAALGWSRTVLTGAVTLQSFTNLASSPVIGRLLDLYGPRLLMVFGAVVASISYMLMGKITEPWHFYLLFTTGFALGLHELGGLITTTVVSKWFIRKRGRALAFTVMGNNLGAVFIVPITAYLIETVGWRTAWALLGAGIAVVVLLPTVLFMRATPEDMGLLPDGEEPKQASGAEGAGATTPSRQEPRWTASQALHTRTLWLIVAGTNLASLTFSSMLYHLVPYFTDIGMSLATASFVFALTNTGALFSKLLYGFLSERIPIRYCLMGNYLGRMLGLLILLLGRSPGKVLLYVAVASPLSYSIGSVQAQIWADYYGRASLGTLRGLVAPFSLLSSIFGPLFAAQVYDRVGSYEGAFWFFAITLVLAAAITYFAKPPGEQPVATKAVEPEAPAG